MINNLKTFQKILKQINNLIKEQELNDLLLKEFKIAIEDINNKINISNNNIEKLLKEKNNLKRLEKQQQKYKIKGLIYTFLPILFALIFSPIIFNTLNPIQAGMILCSLSVILLPIASIIGFEEYYNMKKKVKKIPKIDDELQVEYKNNANLKYDLTFYIYKDIEIKKEQKNILDNIQNLLKESQKKVDTKSNLFVQNNSIYDKLILNKNKIKVKNIDDKKIV